MRTPLSTGLLVLLTAFLTTISGLQTAAANEKAAPNPPDLIYYWDFNSVDFTTPTLSLVDGSITTMLVGSGAVLSDNGQSFANINGRNGSTTGNHLRFNNPIGSALIFNLSTTGYSDIVVKYETRRSGSGAGTQNVSYTTDGVNYTSLQTVTVNDDVPQLITLDFSSITEVDDNPDFAIKIEFAQGAGGLVGNNRFDNVTIEGTSSNVVVPPGATSIVSPADEATDVELRPILQWTLATDATSYEFEVSKSEDFAFIVGSQEGVAGVSQRIQFTLEENSTYFWRVRAKNGTLEGDWSDPANFTTVHNLPAFDIRLNEVMSSNTETLADDDGDFSDWIEVYNQGKTSISLEGFGLSDNPDDPFQWTFPDITLAPGQYIIVWASDKDRTDPADPLHTNFKISDDGENIVITNAGGVTLDVAPAIEMTDDQSYGRFPNGKGEWALQAPSTPGQSNITIDLPFAITSFKFEKAFNLGDVFEDIVADVYGDSLIVAVIPHQQTEFTLKATFSAGSAESITVLGIEQQNQRTSNDFSSTVTYKIQSGNNSKTYKVKLVYTGLPVVYVYTEASAPIVSKDAYIDGNVVIYPSDDGQSVFTGDMEIRGRGNTTWAFPKKPYKIKLNSAAALLGMPADKEWVLLANYVDRTLIRNSLASALGNQTSLAYTPRSTPVEVVVNGVYQGSYLFGEHLKVSDARVDIQELDEDDTDPATITGGYFLQIDQRRDADFWFETDKGIPFAMEDPDEPNDEQLAYIKDYIQQTEDAIFSEDFADPDVGYRKYLNTETFIDWYWINEVLKNNDAIFFSSVYLYKDRDEKLNMGPLWDFDIAAGNTLANGNDNPTGFWIRYATWFDQLMKDPAFLQEVNERWTTIKQDILVNLMDDIDDLTAPLGQSQLLNFYKWNILTINPDGTDAYDGEVQNLKTWLSTRIAWIDASITNPAITPFDLVSQVDGIRQVTDANDTNSLSFSWTSSTQSVTYQLKFDTLGGDFTHPLASYLSGYFGIDTTTTVQLKDLYTALTNLGVQDSLTIQWTVFALLNGTSVKASRTNNITIILGDILLDAPVLVTNTDQTLTPLLKWMDVKRAETFDLQLSKTTDFSGPIIDAIGIPDTTFQVNSALDYQTTYYWRVRSVNTAKESDWSVVGSFTTIAAPPLGLEDEFSSISVYPNPSERELFIVVPSMSEINGVEMIDAVGKVTGRFEIATGSTTRIDVSNLPRGLYVVILKGKYKAVPRKIVLR